MSTEVWVALSVVGICALMVVGAALWLGTAILDALEEFVREDENL